MKNNKRTCRNCDKSIAHKHINAKFCGQKCKDKYHNRTNPRGIFAHKKAKCYYQFNLKTMKGKIFNAQEVQAIIAGNKTQFREVIKPKINLENYSLPDECGMELLLSECPYQVGQKIFVKEVFCKSIFGKAIYKDEEKEIRGFGGKEVVVKWKPAQHMKQEHSRITLEITGIKVERLAEISEEDCKKEGIGYTGGWNGEDYDDGEFYFGKLTESEDGMNWKNEMFEYPDLAFASLWNKTHKKPEEKFEANPWVWVVDFKINK